MLIQKRKCIFLGVYNFGILNNALNTSFSRAEMFMSYKRRTSMIFSLFMPQSKYRKLARPKKRITPILLRIVVRGEMPLCTCWNYESQLTV